MPARMSPSRWLAVGICCFAQPTLAQADDPRIGAALAARDAGRTAEAVTAFEMLVAERPDDPTFLRLLGSAYAAARRYNEAAVTLERAQRLAPADQDIALARARVELWAGRPARAREIAARIGRDQPGNPELDELDMAIQRTSSERSAINLSVNYGVARVALVGPNRTWRDASAAVDAAIGRGWILSADAERSDRQIATDTRLRARVDRRFGDRGGFSIGFAITPNADFRERWGLRAGGDVRILPSVVAMIDVRHADYGPSNITVLEPGLRLETRDGRYSVAMRSINLWDENGRYRSGWSARLDAASSERLALFAGAATYPDTEAGITRRVDSVYAGAGIAVSGKLSLRLTGEYERRAQSYRRTGVSIGLRWRLGG